MDHTRYHNLTQDYGLPMRAHSTKALPPTVPPKEVSVFDLKEALGLPTTDTSTSSSTSIASTAHLAELDASAWPLPPQTTNTAHQQKILPHIHQTIISPPPARRLQDMSQTIKGQHQCLRLCNNTSVAGDRVAEHITEYATMVKNLPHGFSNLANDLIDNCHVLSDIEFGLGEANRGDVSLPSDMIVGLDKNFRAAQAAFRLVDQMIGKQIDHEKKGAMGRFFSRKFEDSGVERLVSVLARARDDLKMSAFMFQWNSEDGGAEIGGGCNALTAILESANLRRQPAVSAVSRDFTAPQYRQLAMHHQRNMNEPPVTRLHPSRSLIDRTNNGFPARNESLFAESNTLNPSTENGPNSPVTVYTASSTHSQYFDQPHQLPKPSNQGSPPPQVHLYKPTPELEALCGDLDKLELDSSKVTSVECEPFTMPRCGPRSTVDAEKANVHNALVAAIAVRDHKRVAFLLDRGVSPNSGIETNALVEAINVQDAESVRLLLLYGADPNEANSEGVSPLVAAARKSFLQGAIALLKYGADPNLAPGLDHNAPLVVACYAGNVRCAHLFLMYCGKANLAAADGNTLLIGSINRATPKVLIDLLLGYGANPNEKNREGKTALFEAITTGRADLVRILIAYRADPNLPGPKHMLWPSTYQPACLQILLDNGADYKKAPGVMELATSINNMESIKILLKAHVDPNAKKDGVYTPLCTSIRDDRGDIFALLLENGANPNVPASEYPCFKCVTHHREHFLPALVSAGADLKSPKGILETAVTFNNPSALKWLMDRGLDPDEKSVAGHTPLTSAIRDSRIEFVKTLLARGANPNVRGEDWPVCMAVRNPEILKLILSVLREPRAFKGVVEMAVHANQLESVKLLLNAGVSVEDRNGGVFSPLTTALRERRREIVQFLINEGGADINAPGEHLPIVKALRRCAEEPYIDMIDMLLDKGADPNRLYRGWNGIMQALENGDAAILEKLCDSSGVDLEAKDELGRTVMEIAESREWKEAVKILKNARHN